MIKDIDYTTRIGDCYLFVRRVIDHALDPGTQIKIAREMTDGIKQYAIESFSSDNSIFILPLTKEQKEGILEKIESEIHHKNLNKVAGYISWVNNYSLVMMCGVFEAFLTDVLSQIVGKTDSKVQEKIHTNFISKFERLSIDQKISIIQKEGHEGKEQQCGYYFNYEVKSGQLIGYTQAEKRKDSDDLNLPFEIWAANYNKEAPTNIDWSFYNGDDRYAHIMCPFDLYAGDLKQQFYAKLGGLTQNTSKNETTGEVIKSAGTFQSRTIPPICGTVNQNIVGTIQGMWFGEGWKNRADKKDTDNSRQFSFLHWNVDPTYAELGNAGEITNGQANQIQFIPKHDGTIDREPSEVKADGNVYCYNYTVSNNGQPSTVGKILAQLVDDRHLKLEYQNGACSGNEAFNKAFNYER